MDKSPEAFRTISEVAELLDTPAHVLRFWESRFAQVRPVKRAGGRRYYRPGDVALLAGIRTLLHDQGVTIRGVQKILRERGVRQVAQLGTGVLGGAAPGDLATAFAGLSAGDIAAAGAAGDVDDAAAAAPGDSDVAKGAAEAAPEAAVAPPSYAPPFERPEPVMAPIVHPAAARLRRSAEPTAGPNLDRGSDALPDAASAGAMAPQNLPRVHAVIHDLFGRGEDDAGRAARAAPTSEPAAAQGASVPHDTPAERPVATGNEDSAAAAETISARLRRLPAAALTPEAEALASALDRLAALRARLVAARRDGPPGGSGDTGPDGA